MTTKSLPGFTLIAPTIWEYLPAPQIRLNVGENNTYDTPSLIILYPWTGARIRYILKYIQSYQILFPSTPILVITTSARDLCFRSSKTKQSRLQPAVNRILSLKHHNNIHMHVFSEGGSNKAVEFTEAFYKTTGKKLPCKALCLDSTPGHPRYLRLCSALRKSLPQNPIFSATGTIVGGTILGAIWLLYNVFKGYDNNVISQTRCRLTDAQIFDLAVPRCYLYSEADALIAWQDVHEHAQRAMERGIPTMNTRFEKSAHCKHAAEDPDRYWDAVMLTWLRACMREKTDGMYRDLAREVIGRREQAWIQSIWEQSPEDDGEAIWEKDEIGLAF